jgi:predicted GNAT superfamily acetyltransferase
MDNQEFVIREPTTFEEFLEIENLQKMVYGFSETEIVSTTLLIGIQRGGGLVLEAFDSHEGKPIAFLLAFLGLVNSGLRHCSYMLGVLPEFRSKGVGYRLKLEQRNRALDQGISLVTWNFDPLDGASASLSFRKLGVVSRDYQRDLFGSKFGTLGAGLPTDRLLVEWWINSSRVNRRLEQGVTPFDFQQLLADNAAVANRTEQTNDLLKVVGYDLNLSNPTVLVEIPDDIQRIGDCDRNVALDWRLCTRRIFESYMGQNYIVVDFLSEMQAGQRRNYYVLQHVTDVTLVLEEQSSKV